MEVLKIIFSGPGAVFAVCATVLTILCVYLRNPQHFRGLILGYKDIKVELPKDVPSGSAPGTPPPEVVVESTPSGARNPELGASEIEGPPELALADALKARDRDAIEAAIAKIRTSSLSHFTPDQFETYKLEQLLGAGFVDALEKLKEIEKRHSHSVYPSLCLAAYYLKLMAVEDAERHAEVAEMRASDEKQKQQVYLIQADIVSAKNKLEAPLYLYGKAEALTSKEAKFTLYEKAAGLFEAGHQPLSALSAYEKALRAKPEAVATRFKAALLYSKTEPLPILAIRHYQVILSQNPRHSATLNNLAILYGNFGLATERTRLLQQSISAGGQHGLGNYASYLIEAGFLEEARKLLEQDRSGGSDNVQILAAKRKLEAENRSSTKKREELTEQGNSLAAFVGEWPILQVLEHAGNVLGSWCEWLGSDSLAIESTGDSIKIIYTHEGKKAFAYTPILHTVMTLNFRESEDPDDVWIGHTAVEALLMFGDDNIRFVSSTRSKPKWTRFVRLGSG
jgi:hypothetical protein